MIAFAALLNPEAEFSGFIFILLMFCFGAIMGSFAGVVIERLPLMITGTQPYPMSLAFPASHCFACLRKLAWWENIPLASFLALRGKCRRCGYAIPARLWLTELAVASYFAFCSLWQADILPMLACCLLGYMLFILAMIDMRHLLLPDILALGLLWSGLLYHSMMNEAVTPYIWGAAAGYLTFAILRQLSRGLLKKEGLGGGDCKLLAALGAWLGWQDLPPLCLFSSLATLFVALLFNFNGKKKEVFPFGPGLSLAGIIIFLSESSTAAF